MPMPPSSLTPSLLFLLPSEPPVKLSRPTNMPDIMEAVAGSPFVLEVEVSRPNAEVKWLVNGREVEEGGKLNVSTEGLVHRLTIQSATPEDSGTYCCQVAGDQVDFQVHVSGTNTHRWNAMISHA